MKNITLKVDDATYRKARIRAAQAGTSVSAMVRDFLNREEDAEAAREAKRIERMKALYALAERRSVSGRAPVEPLSRGEIYAARLR
jgi:plasmid stability protein